MKKTIPLLTLLTLLTLLEPAMAQRRQSSAPRRANRVVPIWYRSRFYTSAGLAFGSANYFGDLTPSTSSLSTDLALTRTSVTAYLQHKFTPVLSARVSLAWQRLKGDDFVSADPTDKADAPRYLRNLHFRNDLIELAFTGIYEFMGNDEPFFRRASFEPYLFGGVGIIYTNPMARTPVSAGGNWVALRPLRTEGQGSPGYGSTYLPVALVVPVGVGVRYKLSQRFNLGLEVGYRFTSTKYLDDVGGRYANPGDLPGLSRAMANRFQEPTAASANADRQQSVRNIARTNFGITNADVQPFDALVNNDNFNPSSLGTRRGSGGGFDWYLVANFHVSYIMVRTEQRMRYRR